jgi:hypothetical protein
MNFNNDPNNVYMNNQDIFSMLNNIMGSGMGNMFNGQFGQMGFNQNMNNIFGQFGNGFFMNQSSSSNSTNYQNNENNEEYQENNSDDEEDESEEELQRRYIELRNSVINQLPRFKFNDYKRMNSGKEIHEYKYNSIF